MRVRIQRGIGPAHVEAAYVERGLAITPQVEPRDGWCVTHLATGLGVGSVNRYFEDAEAARPYLAELLSLPIDWTKSGAEVAAQFEALSASVRQRFTLSGINHRVVEAADLARDEPVIELSLRGRS